VGGYPQRYAKKRVTLKDKIELKTGQTQAPSPESKPASDKTEKKVEKKKG
jgi:hypothetical protein